MLGLGLSSGYVSFLHNQADAFANPVSPVSIYCLWFTRFCSATKIIPEQVACPLWQFRVKTSEKPTFNSQNNNWRKLLVMPLRTDMTFWGFPFPCHWLAFNSLIEQQIGSWSLYLSFTDCINMAVVKVIPFILINQLQKQKSESLLRFQLNHWTCG